ncbi:hypothetical protein, partial [Enterococcus faecalis]|uniref:hypothetical protein n=1 Tax=Enterococcus faecalis TaxID=1351 RepID=UPI0022F044C8
SAVLFTTRLPPFDSQVNKPFLKKKNSRFYAMEINKNLQDTISQVFPQLVGFSGAKRCSNPFRFAAIIGQTCGSHRTQY